MNPLTSVKGTIISGFVLAILVALYVSPESSVFQTRNFSIWLHALFGVTWIGLLYYFNFVQVPAMADALADEGGPGPAAIGSMLHQGRFFGFVWLLQLHGSQVRGLYLSLHNMALRKLFFFKLQLGL